MPTEDTGAEQQAEQQQVIEMQRPGRKKVHAKIITAQKCIFASISPRTAEKNRSLGCSGVSMGHGGAIVWQAQLPDVQFCL
jgi:hypothetical protein